MDICVVIVTFNRKQDLEKTLSLYENQKLSPRAILVVDNHSTDGTAEMLSAWKSEEKDIRHVVHTMSENVGGSGGFYAGMEQALAQTDCEWLFVSDDDALPANDALWQLDDFCKRERELAEQCSAICGVVDAGDHFAIGHRCRIKRSFSGRLDFPVSAEEYSKDWFAIDFFSYIGSAIRRSALEAAGLTRKEFFIYCDDYEHSLRLGRQGKIVCVPSAVMSHQDNNDYSRDASWRDYYATRNLLIMYREYFGAWAAFRRSIMRRLTGLRSLNPTKMKVISAGIKDAKRGVTGLHPIYRPGWDPKKKG